MNTGCVLGVIFKSTVMYYQIEFVENIHNAAGEILSSTLCSTTCVDTVETTISWLIDGVEPFTSRTDFCVVATDTLPSYRRG